MVGRGRFFVRSVRVRRSGVGDRRSGGQGEFLNMGEQFLLTGQAAEVVADHFIGAQRRFASGPQGDEQTGDDAQIGLDGDSVFAMTEQVSAAEHMFEDDDDLMQQAAQLIQDNDMDD